MFNYNTWKDGEKLAKKYLLKNGYKILETNSKLAGAEVDIVCTLPIKKQKKLLKQEYKNGQLLKQSYLSTINNLSDILVFVEVKARSTDKYGLPGEAVTTYKQNQIKKFANIYIAKNNWAGSVRFDVISIIESKIDHIIGAF